MIERILLAIIFISGFTAIIGNKNIIKKIFGLTIINTAIVLLFIIEGSGIGDDAPILAEGIGALVDPIPQALMLTAIVIGVCINSLALAFAYRLFKSTGTFNIEKIYKKLSGSDVDVHSDGDSDGENNGE